MNRSILDNEQHWHQSKYIYPMESGIIYLGWHGVDGDDGSDTRYRARAWRDFVVSNYAQLRRWSDSWSGMQWVGEDLFLYLRQTEGDADHFEDRLLQTAGRIRADWEQRSRRAVYAGNERIRLHAGIALMPSVGKRDKREEWYRGMKRALIHGQSHLAIERSLKRSSLRRIIREQRLYPVYQPIVSLEDDAAFGIEALTRIESGEAFDNPSSLFEFANEEGDYYALDRLARSQAIAKSAMAGSCQKLFLNVTARIMEDPHFTSGQTMLLLNRYGLSPRNVVFEITERSSIDDFAAAKKILDHYRKQGYQIAIDDVGAGYSSLQSIVELRPDYIKVDRSLVDHIDTDEMKQHLMGNFVQLANRMGIKVISEGIERDEELECVRKLGVHYGQGYRIARPARRDAI